MSSKGSAKKGAGAAAAGCVTAKIGGKSKCLKPGQMCSHKNASDYSAYGMTCDKKGNYYFLHKKS